jgi:XTP/dITP diphosphohydrolase
VTEGIEPRASRGLPSETTARSTLVVATLNPAKARELMRLLSGVPYDVRALADVPGARLPPEGETSYHENAIAKARAAARFASAVGLGDDSGLEVDALGGAPGVTSARFGGPGLDDAGRIRYLLERLVGVEPARRTARFRSVIAIVDGDGREHLVEGTVEGLIAEAPRGAGGFGYDPVFIYPPYARTFGEVTDEEKWRVDHRGRAVAAARRLLTG